MAGNDALKEEFKKLHANIVANVDPDQAIDELVAKAIISDHDYLELCRCRDSKSRCRYFLALLYQSTHPEAFIQLRLALRKEYPQIVDEVDKQLPSPTAQPQQEQIHAAQSTYGMTLP